MACIYILLSGTTKKFYVGSSRENNAGSRLKSHNSGKTRSTKCGRPWLVVYEERYENYRDARKREFFLKSGVGRKWIKENFDNLK